MSCEIDVDVLVLCDGVGVGRAALPPALEILAVDEAGVDVVVAQGHAAQPLKVKVERATVDLQARNGIQLGPLSAQG